MGSLRILIASVVTAGVILGAGTVQACNYYQGNTGETGSANQQTGESGYGGADWDSDTFPTSQDGGCTGDGGSSYADNGWGHGHGNGVFGSQDTSDHQDFDDLGEHCGFPSCGPEDPGEPDDGCTPVNPVPEPGTLVLLGCGLLGLARFGRKRLTA